MATNDELSNHAGLGQLPAELLRRLRSLNPIQQWAGRTDIGIEETTYERDPEFLRTLLPLMDCLVAYFDGEVRGFDLLPEHGPMLIVGNHSGGTLTPDTSVLISNWYRERGLDEPLYGLAFDAMFGLPYVSTLMWKIGQLPANMRNAAAALDRNAAVLVYPGGEHDVFRPWTDRNRIDFNGRRGFVKLALRTQVPVVPVVGHGGHDSTIVLTRGNAIADWIGLGRVRVSTFPILLQVPWGISTAGMPSMPLPAKIVLQFCQPLDWSQYGPEGADDPRIVDQCYQEISAVMQSTLTVLAREHPWPVASRVASLIGGSAGSIARKIGLSR